MLKKVTLSIAIGLFFFVTNTATAQIERGRFSVHIGPTIPLDDFREGGIDKKGELGAGIGLGLGIEYIYPLTETGVGLFFGIDINYNSTTSDYEDEYEDEYEYEYEGVDEYGYGHVYVYDIWRAVDEDDITFQKYFNIPISTGLNYTFKADDKLSVYTNLGFVYNFLKITDFTADIPRSGGGGEITGTFDLASNFGVKIGGGIILNDKTYISLNYFGLGKHKIKSEVEYSSDKRLELSSSKGSKLMSEISMLTLTVGFRL